jgi:hypothetical protein
VIVVRGGTMKHRIAMWASAGFLVAGFWALFAIAGRYYPVSLYEVLAANGVTYALVGLIVETLRRQLHHAK